MKISRTLLGKGLMVSAIIFGVATVAFWALEFLLLLTAKDLSGPTGWLHQIGLDPFAWFELDPDDDELILSAALASLPIALMMAVALWVLHGRFALSRPAGDLPRDAGLPDDTSVFFENARTARAPTGTAGASDSPPPASSIGLAPANDSQPGPEPACRACGGSLKKVFLEFERQPLTESLVSPSDFERQPAWPLRLVKCANCHLVQTLEARAPATNGGPTPPCDELVAAFNVETLVKALSLTTASQVVEVASGAGTLLQQFAATGLATVGIEADRAAADIARARGIPTRVCHFSVFGAHSLVKDGHAADLLIARDLISRTVDPTRFADASRTTLKPNGILLFEFPHLLAMIEDTGFETICHERPSYLSLLAVERLFVHHGLRVLHAAPSFRRGWLRVFACRAESTLAPSATAEAIIRKEIAAGLDGIEAFAQFAERAQDIRRRFRSFLEQLRRQGRCAVGFGAEPSGGALLSMCGVGRDMLAFVADSNPEKQGLLLPGTGIPIVAPERIHKARPDFVMVLPGCSVQDVVREHRYVQAWGGRFGCLNVT